MNIIVPATSANLGPGFDALGLSIALFNEVSIELSKFSSVSIKGEGNDNPKLKRNNLFINIFNEIFTELTNKNENFRIVFNNQIPFSRGLGSSSAVIISAIASAYAMTGFKVDKQTILNRALTYENHPDNIAPAVFGGFVSAIIENNFVYVNKVDIDKSLKAVVVIPNKPMRTVASRQILPKNYTIKECVNNLAHAAFLATCFSARKYDLLRVACKDMMHEEHRMNTLSELFEVRKLAYENGAIMSSLSGSGSSFLNIAYEDDAKKLKEKLVKKFNSFRVEIFSFDNDGFVLKQS
ncbi:homoserine kinase [Campylobacter sp. faydin G-140]|uniref:homoserine kinase n=1 Tax=Campylobacter anatolicus TaxID=2829105 RepID=UPI001B96FCBD|nr:homoserine kinase [Campylobacter anatolicus]MBR8465002.1 homoserine kinase [Campylobacter anatolicus]